MRSVISFHTSSPAPGTLRGEKAWLRGGQVRASCSTGSGRAAAGRTTDPRGPRGTAHAHWRGGSAAAGGREPTGDLWRLWAAVAVRGDDDGDGDGSEAERAVRRGPGRRPPHDLIVISLCTFSEFKDGEARYSHSGPPPQTGALVCEL